MSATDADGRVVVAGSLNAVGVDTFGVRVVPGVPSRAALICVDEHGENTIVVSTGANDAARASLSRRGDVNRARWRRMRRWPDGQPVQGALA